MIPIRSQHGALHRITSCTQLILPPCLLRLSSSISVGSESLFMEHFIHAFFQSSDLQWAFSFNPLAYINEKRDQRLLFQTFSAT